MSQRPAFERPSTPGEALERAALALQAQRFEEAERLAADILKADRSNAAAARLLGQALLLQARPKEAIGPLSRAARRGGDPALETLLARALSDAGRGEDALAAL